MNICWYESLINWFMERVGDKTLFKIWMVDENNGSL